MPTINIVVNTNATFRSFSKQISANLYRVRYQFALLPNIHIFVITGSSGVGRSHHNRAYSHKITMNKINSFNKQNLNSLNITY